MACVRCGADAELVCEVASDVSTIRVCEPCGRVADDLVSRQRPVHGAMVVRWLARCGNCAKLPVEVRAGYVWPCSAMHKVQYPLNKKYHYCKDYEPKDFGAVGLVEAGAGLSGVRVA